MTMTTPTETIRIARGQAAEKTPSARRLAWLATAGALAVSVLLGVGLPARAEGAGAAVLLAEADGQRVRPGFDGWVEPAWQRKRMPRIPAVCAMEFDSGRRSLTVYPERCLRREGVEARLPVHCAKEARIWGKRDRVYPERCLREAGFRIGGRGHDRDWDGYGGDDWRSY